MLVGAKVCYLTEDLLCFVCGFYVGIFMSSLNTAESISVYARADWVNFARFTEIHGVI